MSFFVDNGIIIDTEYIRRKSMRQLNKLKVAITAGIILLIIIAIVALVLKLNNSTYFSKETSIDTVSFIFVNSSFSPFLPFLSVFSLFILFVFLLK